VQPSILIGHIMSLARPFVRPSVSYDLLTQKLKGTEKPKLVWPFPNRSVSFQLIGSGRRPHNVVTEPAYLSSWVDATGLSRLSAH